jgi:hypothetical protein
MTFFFGYCVEYFHVCVDFCFGIFGLTFVDVLFVCIYILIYGHRWLQDIFDVPLVIQTTKIFWLTFDDLEYFG